MLRERVCLASARLPWVPHFEGKGGIKWRRFFGSDSEVEAFYKFFCYNNIKRPYFLFFVLCVLMVPRKADL